MLSSNFSKALNSESKPTLLHHGAGSCESERTTSRSLHRPIEHLDEKKRTPVTA